MLHRTMDGDGMAAVRIAGKGKGAVGQGERNSSVGHPKAVEHFFAHDHAQGTGSLIYRYEPYTQPLAERVVVVHFVKNIQWLHGTKVNRRSLRKAPAIYIEQELLFYPMEISTTSNSIAPPGVVILATSPLVFPSKP